jgi:hypothetical protein
MVASSIPITRITATSCLCWPKAGIRKIRLYDLRHTFGPLLIQAGASIVYVKEQIAHSSIQMTVDTYGHLIPGANVNYVDRLDIKPEEPEKPSSKPQPDATQTQPQRRSETNIPPDVVDLIGGGGWTRTSDLRIMRRPTGTEDKEDQQLSPEEHGKKRQYPHAGRTRKNS